MPSDDAKQRLPFIRYLYKLGVQQSRLPKPINAASILTFHDSIELFLHLACEEMHNDIRRKDMPFMEYWDVLKDLSDGTGLGYKTAMRRLNTLRVNLKHDGIRPDESEIESARGITTSFFEDSAPIIFNVDFNKISMADLVVLVPARERLEHATALIEQGMYGEALNEISMAFDMIIEDYEKRKVSRLGKSPFHFDPPYFTQDMYDDIRSFVEKSVEPLRKAMRIISLGLDYRQYVRFRQLAPEVLRFIGDEPNIIRNEPPENRTREDCQFCHDFVIDSAIRLQDFDFDLKRT